MPLVKTPARERAKLRANEERRVMTARASLTELLTKHAPDGRDIRELNVLCARLIHAIKHQHVKDDRLEKMKGRFGESQGDF